MSRVKYATMKSLRTFKRNSNAHVKNLPLSTTDAISFPHDSSFKTKQFTVYNAKPDPQKIIETVSKHRASWEEDPSERKRSFFLASRRKRPRWERLGDGGFSSSSYSRCTYWKYTTHPINISRTSIYLQYFLRKYFILRSVLRSTFPGAKGQLLSVKGNTSV